MFAHGFGTTPAAYAPLLSRIAAAGYVVAAPTYPLLSGQPAGPSDTVGWGDLAPDTWFVTSRVLALSASGDPSLGGLIDPNRIAVAGHSDGAAIAFNNGFTPFDLDPRVRAVISYAADLEYYGPYQPNGRPILHVLSDQDIYNPYGDAIAWDRSALQQPKTVLSLWNASHGSPFLDPGDGHWSVVANVTIGWLDTVLKAHPEGLLFASFYVANHPDLASME
jgi:acetyl esterase/lipase